MTRLAECAGGDQFADAVFVVAENVFEDVLIVLAQGWSGAADARGGAREFCARAFDGEFSCGRMVEGDEVAAVRELRIAICCGAVLDAVTGDAVGLKQRFDRGGIAGAGPCGD